MGETYSCDATSAVLGLTSDVSWTTSGGYLSLSGTGFYRNVTVTQYFSGTATVQCSWKYRLYSGDTWKTQSRSWTIRCIDNPASIYPTELTLSQGETANLGYSHAYSNNYVSAAQAYFSSSNPSIATVSRSGLVTAVASGTTYINLYSKISSTSPYCKVTVKDVQPQNVSIPSNINVTVGETKQLTANVSPADASVFSIKWESDDSSIATVSSSGLLKGVKHGTTKVRCLINSSLYSNSATVTVSEAALALSASHESGLMEAGATVTLTASNREASIYYTLDGTTPSVNSTLYTAPIVLERDVTLKAIACHEDYEDSEILVRQFEVTSLKAVDCYPEDASDENRRDIIPMVAFDVAILKNTQFDGIELRNELDEKVECEPLIMGQSLYVVPDALLDDGTYTLVVPERSVMNSYKEGNMALAFSFQVDEGVKINAADIVDIGGDYLITGNGDLYMWGSNYVFNFPDPDMEDTPSPVFVMSDVQKFYGQYFIKADDSLWGWGCNYNSFLGNNPDNSILGDGTKYERERPVKILSDVVSYQGGWHDGALKKDGTLWIWGQNRFGQIGDGTSGMSAYKLSPTKVLSDVKAFSLGTWHSIALQDDGTLLGWGYPDAIGRDNVYVPYEIATDVKECYAESFHNVLLKNDNSLWTFGGNNYGQIGDGTTNNRIAPVKIMEDVAKCAASYAGTWALKDDGRLYHWGIVGHYSIPQRTTPTLLIEDVKDFFVTDGNVYVLKNDKTLWSCGANTNGQLGNGTDDDSYDAFCCTIDEVEKVWPCRDACYVLRTDGSIWGWGTSIGNGIYSVETTPVKLYDNERVDIESVDFPYNNYTLPMEGKVLILLSLNPLDADYESIEWQSLDESIASVTQRGVVTGVAEGVTEVKAIVKAGDGQEFVATCKVTVTDPTSIDDVQASNLHVWASDGHLHIEGVAVGDDVSVYGSSGMVLLHAVADAQHCVVPIQGKGFYIVRTGRGAVVKIVVAD